MFVVDLSEEQWHDVMGVSDGVFTKSPGRVGILMMFFTLDICVYIYFRLRARPYGHP